MRHVPQLPGGQWIHPVEQLLVAEQRARGAEMPAEGAARAPSETPQHPDLGPAALARHPETVPRSLQALLRAEFSAVTEPLATVSERVTATLTGRLPALTHAGVARALQAAAPAAETRTGATASGIAGSTVRCSLRTGPVVAAATPPHGALSPGSGVLRLTPSALRQHMVVGLQKRLEGLTPSQVPALLGTDTDLRTLMRRMFREGLIARPAKGVYAVKTPGAPHSSLGPAGEAGKTTEDAGHLQEGTLTADLPLRCGVRDSSAGRVGQTREYFTPRKRAADSD